MNVISTDKNIDSQREPQFCIKRWRKGLFRAATWMFLILYTDIYFHTPPRYLSCFCSSTLRTTANGCNFFSNYYHYRKYLIWIVSLKETTRAETHYSWENFISSGVYVLSVCEEPPLTNIPQGACLLSVRKTDTASEVFLPS